MTTQEKKAIETSRRMPEAESKPIATMATGALAVASGGMLALAVPNLIGGDYVWAKTALIAGAGALVAFSVNRLAIEKGAPLAAQRVGKTWLVSTASILAVGACLATATYSGLVLNDVETLRLQRHAQDYTAFVEEQTQAASQASRIAPAMRAVVSDLAAKEACEIDRSCLSGRGRGGEGPVSNALAALRQRAEALVAQVEAGERDRQSALAALKKQISAYADTIETEDLSPADRRKALQGIDAEIREQLNALDEAAPTALVAAYANELRGGITITARPVASRNISTVLRGHGESLADVLASIEGSATSRPPMPKRTGVDDTFEYIGHFLPVAAVVALVELIFPITLWIYTYYSLIWAGFRRDPELWRKHAKRDEFSELVTLPATDLTKAEPDEEHEPPVKRKPRANGKAKLDAGETW